MAVFFYLALGVIILVIYSSLVKLRDLDIRPSVAPEVKQKANLKQLREQAETSPSFQNRAALGWGLIEHEQYEDAAACFEQALSTHATDKDALLGLGRARIGAHNHPGAIEALSTLVDRNFAYDDYGAAMLLAEALFEDGQTDNALGLVDNVRHASKRIDHGVTLAKYQIRAARRQDAEDTLRRLLENFEGEPEFLRRRHGAVATDARRLLRTLEEDPGQG